jgi:hypothetical protein
MREDFPQLLCEKSRLRDPWFGSKNLETLAIRRKTVEVEEDLFDDDIDEGAIFSGGRVKIRPVGFWSRKDLNENLSPLARFLEKSVGRKWSEVFAEICAVSPNSAVGSHVFEHLFDAVALSASIVGGKVVAKTPTHRLNGRGPWAVHPVTGCLVLDEGYKGNKPQKGLRKISATLLSDGDRILIARVKGVWHTCNITTKDSYHVGNGDLPPEAEELRAYLQSNKLFGENFRPAKGRRLKRVCDFLRK